MTTPEVHPLTVRLAELSDRTARQVLELLDQLAAGTIRPAQLPELAGVLLKLGADQAAGLAAGELVSVLADAGVPVSRLPDVAGVTAQGSVRGGEQAVSTILAGPVADRRVRLERLARGAVSRAGQDMREDLIRRAPYVQGWTRGLDSAACQLCVWWWREGRVWPKTHHMPRHPGCTCVQVPAVSRNLRGVSREALEDSNVRRELERRGEYLAAFGTDRRHTSQ